MKCIVGFKVYRLFLISLLFLQSAYIHCQSGSIKGTVFADGTAVGFAIVSILPINENIATDFSGRFEFNHLPDGTYILISSFIGFKSVNDTIEISTKEPNVDLTIELNEKKSFIPISQPLELDEFVVTATKTPKRKTNSNIIVNILNSESLELVQACNLSEGLKFQPGLRVETDCQTCNYTQLRMNGLAGGYSQILINGRPIFSPLTGLYGMEQLPTNMIDRIEVIRGGGSSLYGSSAVGGTVNVITRIPKRNNFELNYTYQNINLQTSDQITSGNGTWVSKDRRLGSTLFFNHRTRGFYDHNEDDYSELSSLANTSFGLNTFFKPNDNQKLEVNFSNLNEYRLGGEMNSSKEAHLLGQSEERTHRIWMGGLDYQINLKNNRTSIITYLAFQHTGRDHYTGVFPDDSAAIASHLENPPYGSSNVFTGNLGAQINHKIKSFVGTGSNVFTIGSEFLLDDVYDEIPSYAYLIDQSTTDLGVFVQSDWSLSSRISLLSGVRMDRHNFVDPLIFSPRASLMYKLKKNLQVRLNYGSGFRAPQAFDTDLHIAFSGGGVSRVTLSPDLQPERSHSYSTSINYDQPYEDFIIGFTLEGFYTRLNRAFYLQPVGEDEFGYLFEKQNGQGAAVQGATIELRMNYNRKVQLESGFTLQNNRFDTPVAYIEGLEGIRDFIRTPTDYGFALLSFTPNEKINGSINYVYTGKMIVPHFAGAPNQDVDEMVTTDSFSELNFKLAYYFQFKKPQLEMQFYLGIKNIFNAYQSQFDIGKNRDSNFIYGPAQPRTFFVGVKLMSL